MVTVPADGTARHVLVAVDGQPTVGGLHEALGLPAPTPEQAAGPLRHGYEVLAPARAPSRGAARLVVAAGPDAGASAELRYGAWVTVGRARTCGLVVDDPALSRVHFRVRLDRQGAQVEDLGSTNGVTWEGPVPDPGPAGHRDSWPTGAALRAGGSRFELAAEPLPPLQGRDCDGRLEVRPWPRPLPTGEPVRLHTPTPPVAAEVRRPSAWSWVLPLAVSLVAAALLRMPMVLLFGLMAPAMVLGHHLGERRSARREHEQALTRHVSDSEALAQAVRESLWRDLHDLRLREPGLLGVARAWDGGPTTALWSRGGEPPTVVLGEGSRPSGVMLDHVQLEHPSAPVALDLSSPVALVGPASLTAAAARSWLLQLATARPPSRLGLVVDPEDLPGPEWDLLAWLPHTCPAADPTRAVNVVWGAGILVCRHTQDVPAGLSHVVLSDVGPATLRRPGQPDVTFRPSLLSLPLARHLARGLSPLVEVPAGTGHGRAATLGDLVPWPQHTDEVRTGWSGAVADLEIPLGIDHDGVPVVVDLARDGPHALVAGTTGSGKSELLRTLVIALALRNRPSRLSLLLVDYKGGSSLGECAGLPHTTGLVTDLDQHLAERMLTSLTAELRRREEALAAVGARDLLDYRGDDIPRLVVVIDEFRVLAEELPEFLGGLVRLAAVGRSLGVHLVLATQRPAGVVSADLRANVNLRIALRVRDRADSIDVLEAPDAAELPEGRPGLALLRTGAAPPRQVQVVPAAPGTTGQHRPRDGSDAYRVEEVDGAWAGWSRLHAPVQGHESGLGDLPALLSRVAAQDGDRAARVWLPPLPDRVPAASAPGAWALADRPACQSQEALGWDGRSHLAVVGAARTGRTTALRSALAAAGPCWLYVMDLGRGLESTEVSDHPGLRGWVGPHDPAHGLLVLERIGDEVDRRTGRGDQQGAPVVLALDGWDRFVDSYRDVDGGRARDLVLRILRDGPGAGVVVLLSGDRSLLSGAVAAEVPDLWALHLHDAADLLMAGLRRHQVPDHRPPGRMVRTRDGLVAQVLVLDPAGAAPAPPPCGTPPPSVTSLPVSVTGLEAWAVGGDAAMPLPVPAGHVLVLGPPGSGVTTTLAALESQVSGPAVRVGPDDAGSPHLAERLHDFTGTVVVDDAHLLAGSRAEEVVLGWASRTGGRLLVGCDVEASSGIFRGLVLEVGRRRTGVVLNPSSAAQGAPLGVRLPVDDRRVPGRGVLVERGRCTRVQVVSRGGRDVP